MKRTLILVCTLSAVALSVPAASFALPVVGDVVGTSAAAAKASLAKLGCTVDGFEAEGGKIDARCTDNVSGKLMEVTVDPKTGAVLSIKDGD